MKPLPSTSTLWAASGFLTLILMLAQTKDHAAMAITAQTGALSPMGGQRGPLMSKLSGHGSPNAMATRSST
jgi:hypothetical protein